VFTLFLLIFTDVSATAFWALHPQLTSIHTNIMQRQNFFIIVMRARTIAFAHPLPLTHPPAASAL
jgi:hypothetical protein